MTQKHSPLPSLTSLAAQWQLLGLMLVALSRQMSGMMHANPQGAAQLARKLDIWLAAAALDLARQLRAEAPRCTREEAAACQHMQAILTALLSLALWLQLMQRKLSSNVLDRAPPLQAACGPAGRSLQQPARIIPYLDSS